MATITTTLTIADRMTAPLRNITSALQCTVDALHSVNTATVKGFDTTAVNKAQRAINMCNNEINKIFEKRNGCVTYSDILHGIISRDDRLWKRYN